MSILDATSPIVTNKKKRQIIINNKTKRIKHKAPYNVKIPNAVKRSGHAETSEKQQIPFFFETKQIPFLSERPLSSNSTLSFSFPTKIT